MKRPSLSEDGRSGHVFHGPGVRTLEPPFTILELQRVEWGSIVAIGRIEVAGLGTIEVEYLRPARLLPFVAGRTIQAKWGGEYVRTVDLDTDFAAAVREAIEARLAADGECDE